jgi:hypothetical protein
MFKLISLVIAFIASIVGPWSVVKGSDEAGEYLEYIAINAVALDSFDVSYRIQQVMYPRKREDEKHIVSLEIVSEHRLIFDKEKKEFLYAEIVRREVDAPDPKNDAQRTFQAPRASGEQILVRSFGNGRFRTQFFPGAVSLGEANFDAAVTESNLPMLGTIGFGQAFEPLHKGFDKLPEEFARGRDYYNVAKKLGDDIWITYEPPVGTVPFITITLVVDAKTGMLKRSETTNRTVNPPLVLKEFKTTFEFDGLRYLPKRLEGESDGTMDSHIEPGVRVGVRKLITLSICWNQLAEDDLKFDEEIFSNHEKIAAFVKFPEQ